MAEIRRILDQEGEAVAGLWDEMARSLADGGPLSPRGRRNIARMLEACAWHHEAFCLVADDGDRVVGFVNGALSAGDGLLPGLTGEIESLYVSPDARGRGLSGQLAEAAIAWLRRGGAGTIRQLTCIDDQRARELWLAHGFERDMVCLSLYAED
ncbi:MAG: GNAT family N-acetyltransferase [Solirubrobacteraceae bacterium]